MVKYRDSEGLYCGFNELSYCTLRSQLLMALHDDNNPVASRDRCHELAWTLDAGAWDAEEWSSTSAGWRRVYGETVKAVFLITASMAQAS